MNKPILIEDDRLTPDMGRIRSGSTQLFRRKGLDNKFTSTENADVILEPSNRELYAELLDGKWYWINGCAECNGKPRDWTTYIECEKHNVCRTCSIPRKELKEPPWGGKHGWQCKPCADVERKAKKIAALETIEKKEYDAWDYKYTDEVLCPHCGTEQNTEYGDGGERECRLCNGKFSLEIDHAVKYSTEVIGDRIMP